MSNLDEDRVKEALKEGLKEWLDEQYARVGRWTVGAFLTMLFSTLVWLILYKNGFTLLTK